MYGCRDYFLTTPRILNSCQKNQYHFSFNLYLTISLGQIPWCGKELVSARLCTVVAFNCTCIKHIITLVFPSSDLQDQFTDVVQSSPHILGLLSNPSEPYFIKLYVLHLHLTSLGFRRCKTIDCSNKQRINGDSASNSQTSREDCKNY